MILQKREERLNEAGKSCRYARLDCAKKEVIQCAGRSTDCAPLFPKSGREQGHPIGQAGKRMFAHGLGHNGLEQIKAIGQVPPSSSSSGLRTSTRLAMAIPK